MAVLTSGMWQFSVCRHMYTIQLFPCILRLRSKRAGVSAGRGIFALSFSFFSAATEHVVGTTGTEGARGGLGILILI